MSSPDLGIQPTVFVSINGRLCPKAVWGSDGQFSEAGNDLFQIKEQGMSSAQMLFKVMVVIEVFCG